MSTLISTIIVPLFGWLGQQMPLWAVVPGASFPKKSALSDSDKRITESSLTTTTQSSSYNTSTTSTTGTTVSSTTTEKYNETHDCIYNHTLLIDTCSLQTESETILQHRCTIEDIKY